ncbi:MAG TPA: porin [Acetobacteraceae bacterium]|nr:porin [Acetobacteraceae bacterium]
MLLPPSKPSARVAAAALALLAALSLSGPAAAEQGQVAPEVRLGEAVTLRPTGLLHLDLGSTFGHSAPGGPDSGLNARRARLGVQAQLGEHVEAVFIWDFGGTPGRRNRLYEASLSYKGIEPFTLVAGVFEPSYSLLQGRSARHLLFLERPAITEVTSDLAGGSGRVGIELRANQDRWFAAAALTGGRTGPGEDSGQRGALARLAALPVRTEEVTVHLGVSGAWAFRPPREDGRRAVTFADQGELAVARRDTVDTGAIPADSAWAYGAELGFAWRRLVVQGEWHGITVDRADPPGGRLDFTGWYAQAGWVLVGGPRPYRPEAAAWGLPQTRPFDPAAGEWGAVEIGLRHSVLSLISGDVSGGRQNVTSLGLGWWPAENLGVLAQWQAGRVAGGEAGGRRWQAVGLRVMVGF